MVSSFKNVEGKEFLNVQLVSNEVKQPILKSIPNIAYKQDPSGTLSMILPNVIMVQDVRKCYNGNMGSIGDLEIIESYDRLCENGFLKEEYKIVERKGLMCALDFPSVFKTEWINIVLSQIYDGSLWLENGTINITKRIFHRVTS
jgi:hypothetical protein